MTHLTRGPVLMRAALIPATLILFVLVSGFLAQVRWATDLWPWPAKPLSYIFHRVNPGGDSGAVALDSTYWRGGGGSRRSARSDSDVWRDVCICSYLDR